MAIQAQMADGRVLEFPDGTDTAVIQKTVQRLIAAAEPDTSPQIGSPMGEGFGSAIMAASKPSAPENKSVMTGFDAAPVAAAPVKTPVFREPPPATDVMGNVIGEGMENQVASKGLPQLFQAAKPKPPTEMAVGEEAAKGAASGVIGLKSMWENAGVLKDVGALTTVQQRLDAFGKIDSGQITDYEQLHGLDLTTSQARSYLASDPATREKMKSRLLSEAGNRKDFVKASIETINQYQKDAEKYRGRTTDLTDVEGAKDFANWLAFNVGSGAVQMAPIMLAAVTTGGAGVAALGTTMGVSEAVGNRMEALAPKIKDLPPDQKAEAVAAYIQKTGDTSLGVGVISGAFDTLLGPAAALVKRGIKEVLKGETKVQALKAGIKEIPKQMGEEFIAGGGQEFTQQAGAALENEIQDLYTKETAKKVLNSAAAEAAGALSGGAGVTAARVYGATGQPEEKKPSGIQSLLAPKEKPIPSAEQMMRDRGFLIPEQKQTLQEILAEPTTTPPVAPVATAPTNLAQQRIEEQNRVLDLEREMEAPKAEGPTEQPKFDSTGWTKSEKTINKKTGELNIPEGVERYTKEDEDGNKHRVITRNGEVSQSETTTPAIELTNSIFGDEGETISGHIKVNNLNGALNFFPDDGGPIIKMSPRASQQYKEGVPVNKIAELEFSDAGGIRPDGTKTPHTTTSAIKGVATPVEIKTNVAPTVSAQDQLEVKEPTPTAPATTEAASPLKQRFDKLASRQAAMQSAKRDGLVTNEEYTNFTNQLAQARAAYGAEQATSQELTPTQQEASFIADKLEEAGHAPFARGMRINIERNQLTPQGMDFYRQKLQDVTQVKEQAQNQGVAEKRSLDDFYDNPKSRTNSPEFLTDYRTQAPNKVRMLTDEAESVMQELVKRINAAGFKVDDVSPTVGKALQPYKQMLSQLSGGSVGVVGREAGIRKKYKNSNPASFKTAQDSLRRDIDSARRLLDEEIIPLDREALANETIPDRPEVQDLLEKSRLANQDVATLSKRTAGGSLMKVLEGSLKDSEMSELSGRARQVGKNPFISLVAKKPKPGTSMEDMVESGILDKFLPPKMRTGNPSYDNQESAAHIREKLIQNQYYTYDTQIEIDRVQEGVWDIEKLIQEELSIDDINKEIQLAFDEQREADLNAPEAVPGGEARGATEGEGTKAEPDFLTTQTNEELKAKQDEIDRLQKENDRLAKEAERKAKADEQANDFVLTGSNREADQAAARGQRDIFAEAPAEEAPAKAPELSIEYNKALEESTKSNEEYSKALLDYRAGKINDDAFLVERKKHELAVAKFDQAFKEEQNRPAKAEAAPEVASEVVGPAEKPLAPKLTREPVTIEGEFTEVGEEKQRLLLTNQTSKLSDAQIGTLEQQYGAKQNSEQFLEALRKDVIAYVTKGAAAVHGRIRTIIRQLANGLLSVAVVFNPQFVSKPYTIAVPQYETRTSEVIQALPREAKSMSDAAKRAYGVIYPALESQLKSDNKLFIVADKQSGNTYMFNPDGSLLLQSKTLFGAGIGDFMKGDNNIVANRITPAGLFDLGLRDAKRSEGEAQTAGEYDFGKVFVLDKSYMGQNGPYSNTIMHSVWTHEADAKKRLAALDRPGAEDSRYSFGCINVNKETFRNLVTNHLSQVDGAKIFIVPENGSNVMDFVNGKATYSTDIIRQRTEPVTKTTTTETQRAAPAQQERTMAAKEEEGPTYFSIKKTQTQTPQFKQFFGDSKVVADGKPLLMYTGTSKDKDFTKFNIPRNGAWFTSDPKSASDYARENDNMGFKWESGRPVEVNTASRVLPVYLRIENPYTMTEEDVARINKENYKRAQGQFFDELRAKGYDGVDFGHGIFVVLKEPTQIKSAIGNNGEYSIKNPHIAKNITGGNKILIEYFERTSDMVGDEEKRSPSLVRTLKTYNRQRRAGKMSEEMYILMSDAAIRADEERRMAERPNARERGYLHIQERMSAAVRKGDLSREAYDLANWFMQQNEALVDDLGISIKGKGPAGTGGFYTAMSRIMTLIKDGGSNETATHEILHHLERMMPTKIREGIRKAWLSQLTKAQKAAKSPSEKLYFAALIDAHFGDNDATLLDIPEGANNEYASARLSMKDSGKTDSFELAKQLLMLDFVPIKAYQYFNPSEFWAVNGSRLVQGRYDAVKGGVLTRLTNWLRDLGQKIKSVFGLKSDASIIRALDSLSKSDGKFVTDDMLGEADTYAAVGKTIFNQQPLVNWTAPDMNNRDDFLKYWQNRQIDTKRIVDEISKSVGVIEDQWNPYLLEELFHGRVSKETKDFLVNELRPSLKEMEQLNVSIPELEEYLHNKHAEERNVQVAKVNPSMPDGGSGIDTADARNYLANLSVDQKANLDQVNQMVKVITANTRQLLVDSGLEAQKTINAWNNSYKNYVPLKREDVDYSSSQGESVGQGISVRGSASKRAIGSSKNVVNVLANIALHRESTIVRAEKNRVAISLYGLVLKNPNPSFWLAVNPDSKKDMQATINELIAMGLTAQDAANLMKEPTQTIIDAKTGLVTERINPILRGADNVISLRINGKDRFVFFNQNNPRALRMVESLKNLDADQLGFILGNTAKVTRYFASVNTQYNPVFGAYNFLRDTGGGAIQLSNTPLAGKQLEVAKHVFPALLGIYLQLRADRDGKVSSNPMSKLWEEFQREGGQTGFRDQFSRADDRTKALESELKKMSQGVAHKVKDALLNWLSDYNETMENAVRLAAYKVALDNRLTLPKSASLAKNLTVNFNRKGDVATQAGALFAYFNSAVQGTATMVATLAGPAGKVIIGGGLFAGVIQATLLSMYGFGDDDPPDFVKDKSFIWPFSDGTYFAFPMPLGYNVIPSTSRIITEGVLAGKEGGQLKIAKRIEHLLGLYMDAFNPVGNAGWSMQTITPTAFDWFAAIKENKDWTGKPIAREDFNKLDPTPGFKRAKEAASIFGKELSRFLNYASGGTEDTAGIVSPTPDQIDYLIGQATGGLGREALKATATAKAWMTGEDLPSHKIPLVGRFYGDIKGSSSVSTHFYENIKQMNEYENTIKGMAARDEDTDKFMKENPSAELYVLANKVEKNVQQLRKLRHGHVEAGAKKEVVQSDEKLIVDQMMLLNDAIKEAENPKRKK